MPKLVTQTPASMHAKGSESIKAEKQIKNQFQQRKSSISIEEFTHNLQARPQHDLLPLAVGLIAALLEHWGHVEAVHEPTELFPQPLDLGRLAQDQLVSVGLDLVDGGSEQHFLALLVHLHHHLGSEVAVQFRNSDCPSNAPSVVGPGHKHSSYLLN